MALENKLGLTSSADLAREEERISKKQSINTSLRTFTTSQVSSEPSILQRAISALPL